MIKLIFVSVITLFTAFFAIDLKKSEKHETHVEETADKNYQTYCSGCHGGKMDAFVDRKWKYGNSPENLYNSIKSGYVDGGMPAFEKTFSDKEIKDLANYILLGIKNVDKYTSKEKPLSDTFKTEQNTVKLVNVFSGAKVPWGIAFLPGGKMLVTDRSGELYLVDEKTNQSEKVSGVPAVRASGQGGLMDVILHPNFAKNNTIYLSYSKPKEDDSKLQTTAILKATLKGNQLENVQDIFVAQPYSTTRHHYGSRLVFGKDGYLYFSVGERGNEKQNPQDKKNDLGKVHRIKADGSIPSDNPFADGKDGQKTIYSYGHRNPQGMALNPYTGEMWSHEHGPRGGDEINIHVKAANYGWPITSYGINYNGTTFTEFTTKAGIEAPIHYWIPSIGPSGMAFVNSKIYKGWEGNLMVGSLRFEYLNRCVIKDKKIIKEELLFKNIGRVREVRMAPNGYLYIGVEGQGVFKIMPVS